MCEDNESLSFECVRPLVRVLLIAIVVLLFCCMQIINATEVVNSRAHVKSQI